MSAEELKRRDQKELRQRKSREQREAERARQWEEHKQQMERRTKAAQAAAQMLIERLELDTLKDLARLLREAHGHSGDNFVNFLAEAAGMDLPRSWRGTVDLQLKGTCP